MEQQEQTLNYFKSHAQNWQAEAIKSTYSVIDNRHKAVLETMKNFPTGSSLLDVGCGTGQLAIQASKMGWWSTGIDFAPEMVEICLQNNKKEQTTAKFECGSIFDMKANPDSLDVISAQGFIEYISLSQLDDFLAFCAASLKSGGAVAIGSRNRLFNLNSLNEFTELEASLGTLDKLMMEGKILQMTGSQKDAIEQLSALGYEYEQPTVHPLTGVKVDTRYQFTPADLITRFARHQLKVSCIYPVNYHSFPVSMMKDESIKNLYTQLAKVVADDLIGSHKLIPYSSSFVIEARKI